MTLVSRLGLLAGVAFLGTVIAAEEGEAPDSEFLEYLGMWEESDEDWQLLDKDALADNEERSDPAPDGEESTEKEDES